MCLTKIAEFLADVAAVVGAGISVVVYRRTVNKERRLETLAAFSEIRRNFERETIHMTEDEKKKYLRELEYFCVGINRKVYDLKTLRRMAGRRLYGQYCRQGGLKDFISERREKATGSGSWKEYEIVMKKLEKYYRRHPKEEE